MKNAKVLPIILSSLFIVISCNQSSVVQAPVVEEIAVLTEQEEEFTLPFEKFTLSNGLEVILHEDHSDPIVAVSTLMHVGSSREKPGKTGFAHFFEHMAFNDSENVPVGANRKLIPEWGGQRNGGTWSDGTIYFEVVPKDAFDKILWIDSDRLGYMIKTVTTEALEREKQVVKNEKRQRVDNQPYGYTGEIISSNLYPADHPYHWTTLGSLPDLQAATLEDVTEFYNEFYGASNASLVIAGDIDIEETKKKVEQWFGEIPSGQEVAELQPRPVTLEENKHLYFEDNFAKLPELRMVFPTVEAGHPDIYALEVLGNLLSGSRKASLYQEVVENQKLAPNVASFQRGSEIAGTFTIRVRANENQDLDQVKAAIENGFGQFESNGFSDSELIRIKAELETALYFGIETVLGKANQMVRDNEFTGNPAQVIEDAKQTNAVQREDVMRVFNKYIKGQNYLMTSVVPEGHVDLSVQGSTEATVWKEEVKKLAASEEVSQGEEAVYEKTASKFDRSEPAFGETPLYSSPDIYDSNLSNGMRMLGIENNELPLVGFSLTIDGGHYLDPIDKPGVANLLVDMLIESTAHKSAAELEEAIGLLGAFLNTSFGNEEITISGSCLEKNFPELMTLVEEVLLEPNWDENNLIKLKSELKTALRDRETSPTSVASDNLRRLMYGEEHILSTSALGDLRSIDEIQMSDLKKLYKQLVPQNANFHIVGAINEQDAQIALNKLNQKWQSQTEVNIPTYSVPQENKNAGNIFFIDIPGSKQSTIYTGALTTPGAHPDYPKIKFANEILGGGISGRLTQTLRIEKGYTYGAYSGLRDIKETVPFIASTSVRANATLPSLEIIQDMIGNYSDTFTAQDADITINKVLKQSTREFESLGNKLGLLREISKYEKPKTFFEEEQDLLINMSLDDFKSIIETYYNEDEFIYVIVGDAATQLEEVNQLGKGEAIVLDIYGNVVQEH